MISAAVAQLVERPICTGEVTGSKPVSSSNETEDRHAPTPPKAGPLHQASGGLNTNTLSVTARVHGGHLGKGSESAAVSQRSDAPEALNQSGSIALPSARCWDATASQELHRPAGDSSKLVRRTDGVTVVAQPGSAPRDRLGEVVGSNPISGSVGGSIPPSVSTGAGCDSGDGERGLVPSQVGRREERSPNGNEAQSAEHAIPNRAVAGSSPAGPATERSGLRLVKRRAGRLVLPESQAVASLNAQLERAEAEKQAITLALAERDIELAKLKRGST